MKNLMKFFFCLLIVSCSPEDDDVAPIPDPDPIDNGGDGDGGDSGNGENGDPLLYNATEDLNDLVEFPIGNIVSAARLTSTTTTDQNFRTVLLDEYDRITAENDMKMANIFTGPGEYNFSDGDAIIAFAKENGLRVHGHALVWHSSIPNWLQNFQGTDEEFSNLIKNYIHATVSHFSEATMTVDGQEVPVVTGWDVVNEAFDGAGDRNSLFYQRMGSNYVAKAFQWAREADPNVALFYNDYNIAGEVAKRGAILNMVNNFKSNGIPIDGIGMQMHLNYDWPISDLATAIQQIADSGLLVHISELDVKVNHKEDLTELTTDRARLQEEQFQRAAYHYVRLVPEDQKYGLTLWGFRDQDSWLYKGGSDWPLLYDQDFNTKIAHRGLVQGLKGIAP